MGQQTLPKYGLFVLLVVLGAGIDLGSKHLAATHLASYHPGVFDHAMMLRVPKNFDGKPLRDYLRDRFEANRPEEIDLIATRFVMDYDARKRLGPESTLRAGQQLRITRRTIAVVPSFFDLQYTRNPGAAFGILANREASWRLPFFLIISALALMIILGVLRSTTEHQRIMLLGLGLTSGGALGNLVDRLRLGYVVDFIVIKFADAFQLPTFNIADALICLGVGLMLIEVFRENRRAMLEASLDDEDSEPLFH